MLESLPDVFMPATEWEWAVMERCIEITVAPNRVLPAYGARPQPSTRKSSLFLRPVKTGL